MREPSEFASEFTDQPGMTIGEWQVPVDGFEWVTDTLGLHDGDPGPWLVPRGPLSRRYAILRRRKTLAREFAALGRDPTLDRILSFASKWGSLGIGERPVFAVAVLPGASLREWRQATSRFAGLWQLWQWVRTGSPAQLEACIRWNRKPLSVGFVSPFMRPAEYRRGLLAAQGRDQDPDGLLLRWSFGDPVEPMRFYICREVNSMIAGHVDRAVLPFYGNRVRYFPDSLLATSYLAFQDIISGVVAGERECEYPDCPRRFFSPTRRNQRYCADNCRKRAYEVRERGKS